MIEHLRKKFIMVSMLSFLVVFSAIISAVYLINYMETVSMLDSLADAITKNGGEFPSAENISQADSSDGPDDSSDGPDDSSDGPDDSSDGPDDSNLFSSYHEAKKSYNKSSIENTSGSGGQDMGNLSSSNTDTAQADPEAKFTTRFFTILLDADENVESVNLKFTASVTEEEAVNYAYLALKKGHTSGWVGNFRYKITSIDSLSAEIDTEDEAENEYVSTQSVSSSESSETSNFLSLRKTLVVMVSGAMYLRFTKTRLMSVLAILIAGGLLILFLLIPVSRKVVRPAVESYEKQLQFITDANHELKTPLSLISANLDIALSENGENEWLEDARAEAEHMAALVDRIVSVARMDEASQIFSLPVPLSEIVAEDAAAFMAKARSLGEVLSIDVDSNVIVSGDASQIHELIFILMDNAVKYCNPSCGGQIKINLRGGKHPVLTVDNTYINAESVHLDKLFDRFYREDKARTEGSGFGIGLSIARSICERCKARISAHVLDPHTIRFKVRF